MVVLSAPKSGTPASIPVVAVISGPSGVGKDAVIEQVRESGAKLHYVVTATTRPRRQNEKDGTHYHFFSTRQFNSRVHKDEFLEYAEVYGHYYGVLKSEVKAALKKGEDVIIKVDVQGAATLKKKIPAAIFIFLMPESLEDLALRLKKRNAEIASDMKLRLSIAKAEMKQRTQFDYTVINYRGKLDLTARKIMSIIEAEKCRVNPKKVVL
jgi:guanylate kinase